MCRVRCLQLALEISGGGLRRGGCMSGWRMGGRGKRPLMHPCVCVSTLGMHIFGRMRVYLCECGRAHALVFKCVPMRGPPGNTRSASLQMRTRITRTSCYQMHTTLTPTHTSSPTSPSAHISTPTPCTHPNYPAPDKSAPLIHSTHRYPAHRHMHVHTPSAFLFANAFTPTNPTPPQACPHPNPRHIP